MGEVKSLYGGPTGQREVNQTAVEEAEALLEAVLSGEVVGFTAVRLHCDGLSSYRIAGRVGGFGMVGAIEHVKMAIIDQNNMGD